MRFDGKTNPQTVTRLNLSKLSNVEAPAQSGAIATIIKSQDTEQVAKLLFDDALRDITNEDRLRQIIAHYRTLDRAMEDSIQEIIVEEIDDKPMAMRRSLTMYVSALNELLGSDIFTSMQEEMDAVQMSLQKQEEEDEEEDRRRRRAAGNRSNARKQEEEEEDERRRRRRRRRQRSRKYSSKVALALVEKLLKHSPDIKDVKSDLIKGAHIKETIIKKSAAMWQQVYGDQQVIPDIFKTTKKEDSTVSKELQDQVTKMQEELRKTAIFASLNDAQKQTLAKFSDDEKVAFFKEEDITKREEMLTKKEDSITKAASDESFTFNGETITKSEVGAGAYTMIKAMAAQNDVQASELKKEREARIQKEYEVKVEKRWPYLKGTVTEKAELMKEIEALPEAVKKTRYEMMDAANESASELLKEGGHSHTTILKGEAKLDAIAKQIQTDEPNLTYQQAYAKGMRTQAGADAYKEMEEERRIQ